MKQLTYRIVALPTDVAEAARRALGAGAADHALIRADSQNSLPCRHCLQWAEVGDEMILFPFASIADGPYHERGPIFVHAQPCARYTRTQHYPEQFRSGRALRAYDAANFMIDARLVNGDGPEAAIEALLENPQAAFLQVRSATRGCYTMGVERV